MFTLKSLPYAENALAPHISEQTMRLHHGKHHQAYVDNLNKLVEGTPLADMSLLDVIKASAGQAEKAGIFNNAAQVYNHDFFWDCLRPADQPMAVPTALLEKINQDFGSLEQMMSEFKTVALSQFGSGWAWLVLNGKSLQIIKTANADTAFLHDVKPLFALDVWEHSYYLDYQNRRGDFIDAVLNNLVNWNFVANQAAL
ncbi:MAG: superoxide dismutase [Patescibacteria group bacterium]|nr:superoxide dismutase [Patescibacteria group bacterium]